MRIDWIPAAIRGFSHRSHSWMFPRRHARQRTRGVLGALESLEERVVPALIDLPILLNHPPVAVNDTFSVNEDSILNLNLGTALVGVLVNDTDPDLIGLPDPIGLGDLLLTANLVTSTQHGTLLFLPTGTFIYTPDANFHGIDTFTYQARDLLLSSSNVATVTINVLSLNDAPVSVGDSYSTNEDTTLTIPASGVLTNDTDVDGDPLTASVVGNPAHGSLTLNANGSFTYVPNANYNGTDSFTYRASDGQAFGATTTVTIIVNGVADSPVATNDTYSAIEDSTLTVAVGLGVLINDLNPDGGTLTAAVVSNPLHGTLVLAANGSFVYTPDPNFNGVDTFTYQGTSLGAHSNIATVTINVAGANDAPVAAPDSYTTNEDVALVVAAAGVLTNDSDLDGNTLAAILVSGPAHGTLTLNPNGSFTYTPTANYHGSDSFTYKANDGTADSNVVTVSLTVNSVNDAPVAVNDAYSGTEDTPLNVLAGTGVLLNDTDADGDALTAIIATGPQHGTLALLPTGGFLYTPNANYSGPDSFTYRASDGSGLSNLATVSLTIAAVNDAPVAAGDLYATTTSTPLVVLAGNGVLANDTDAEGQTLFASIVALPQHGVVVLSPDGSFVYTPVLGYNGPDSFTYQASDGTLLSNTATVSILVSAAANSPPVANGNTYAVTEDTPLNITAGSVASGVLGNDTDADFPVNPASQLTATLVSPPQHGTLVLRADGTFDYTPQANYFGTDSFTYFASDPSSSSNVATVTLNIASVNDAPVTVGDSYTTSEDTPLVVSGPGVLGNDSDVDSGSLIAILVTNPTHGILVLDPGGGFTYTPAANYNGPDSFTYRASDSVTPGNIVTVSLNVTGSNDPPVANADSYQVNEDTTLTVLLATGVLLNDTDPDSGSLTANIVAQPQHGTLTLSPTGAFVYTPDANFNGTDTFTYQVSDGQALSNVATVTISVLPSNDAPTASNDTYSATTGVALSVNSANGVLANDNDVDGNTLTATVGTLPLNGQLVLNPNGSFTYTPNAGFTGFDSFTYQASDGTALSNSATVTISVVGVPNRAPVANNDNYAVTEDTLFATTLSNGVLFNDTDADGDTLTAVLISPPSHGTVLLSPNGTFIYTPQADYHGTDSFIYQAGDGSLNSGLATVVLTISSVNDAPVANPDGYNLNENQSLVVTAPGVISNDQDADGNALTATLMSQPAHGTITFNPNGSFTYTPTANYFGTDSFTYRVSDGTLTSNVTTVSLTVNGSNQAPVSTNDAYSIAEDGTLTVLGGSGVLINDTDPDSDPLTATIASQPSHGTVNFGTNGGFVYTPAANFTGTDTFTYIANDGTVNGTAATVTITVTAVNDAPVGVNDSYAVNKNTPLVVGGTGVLANDIDVDGNTLTAQLASNPAHGSVVLNTNGSFTYTPANNYTGTDTFTYRANDGTALGDITTVTLTVTSQNASPVVTTSAGNRTVKGHKKLVLDPAINITDADSPIFNGGQMTVTIQSGAGTNDSLSFGRSGARRGAVNIKRGTIRVGLVVVGTITGGVRGVPIQISFNSNATLARVKSVAAAVIFRGSNGQPGPRVVGVQVTDNTGEVSNIGTKTVNVT